MSSITKTKVVNLSEEYDVYIGRAGRGNKGYFGSPIIMGKACPECGDIHRANIQTIPCYTVYALRRMKSDPVFNSKVKDLKGKTLGCFCKPKACHGDVLVNLAEQGSPDTINTEVPETSNTEEAMTKPELISGGATEADTAFGKVKYYAGIGSRDTPSQFLAIMTACGKALMEDKWILRTGGAKGADTAFEDGVLFRQFAHIYRPAHAMAEHYVMAKKYSNGERHWENLNKNNGYGRSLMARNMMIILGPDLKTPVEFVLCWTPGGRIDKGGTAHGIKVAMDHRIPVFNMANSNWKEQVAAWKADPKGYVDSVYPIN